ncbi:GH25 family lysozyme [Terrilactibacillus sp. S3-3]|nr:GH25 family lysozyme [Terrilactibacillus sp. S3-3]
MQERKTGQRKGIDISHWQPLIDWPKVKKAGIAFAYLKATEGCFYTDLMFKKYYQEAHLAEIKTGFYHFARFTNRKKAKQEAQYFIQAVKNYPVDLPYVLVIEVCPLKMERHMLSNAARCFLETVQDELRNPVMIHTNTAFAREHLDSSLAVYPLWCSLRCDKTRRKWYMGKVVSISVYK